MNTAIVRSLPAFVALIVLAAGPARTAITITIDPATRYQVVEGIGGVARGASTSQAAALVDGGMSAIRYDWCECVDNVGDSKAIMDAGVRKVIASCWSPPGNMKDNGSTNNGGALLASQYSAFADFAVQKVQAFRQQTGFDLYAICLQNEPSFVEFYCSAVYTAAQLVAVYRTVGKRFKDLGIKTRLIFNDDMYGTAGFSGAVRLLLADTLKGDTSAAQYVSALSFHGLSSDGVTPVSLSAQGLQAYYNSAKRGKMQLWMTEGGIDEGLGYARGIIGGFRYGLSLWTKYDVLGSSNAQFLNGDSKTHMYYTAKCIQKFVRPGARVVRSVSSDSAAFTCFFAAYDSAAKSLSVCLGTDNTAQTISLSGSGLPATFQKWVANASTNCVNTGNVPGTSSIDIPANSIVTLYGTGFTPPPVWTRQQSVTRSAPAGISGFTGRSYTIDGRRIAPERAAAGLRLLVTDCLGHQGGYAPTVVR